MKFDVDQSIRVEQLTADSYIAIANSKSGFTLVLPKKLKRKIFSKYKKYGFPKKLKPIIFVACIIILIKRCKFSIKQLVIDIEYPSYELLIEGILKKYFSSLEIYFSNIGKKSPAHFYAYGSYIGKKFPDCIVKENEILSIINKELVGVKN